MEEAAGLIAKNIADYRLGEIPRPDIEHVLKWASQFPKQDREILLSEMGYITSHLFVNKANAHTFLSNLSTNSELSGNNPSSFWNNSSILDIQKNGNSQHEMRILFQDIIENNFGKHLEPKSTDTFIYLDDILFTGNRAKVDLSDWIRTKSPKCFTLHLIFIAIHTFGSYSTRKDLEKVAKDNGREMNLKIWRSKELENRKYHKNNSDVLWPTCLPTSAAAYANGNLGLDPRQPGGSSKVFSSEASRAELERILVEAGMKIRSFSANPSPALKPLGFGSFGAGFGATIATYRNCPNNAPLALWWGDPNAFAGHPFRKWFPLLPRRTYSQ